MKRNAKVQKVLDAIDELLQGNIPGLNEGMKVDLNNAKRTLCHEAFVIKEEPAKQPEPSPSTTDDNQSEPAKQPDKPSSAEQRLKSSSKK